MQASKLVLVLLAVSSPLSAQETNRGVFSIQRGEVALGREEFSVQPTTGRPGTTLASLARYPGAGPRVQIQGVLERNPEGGLVSLQLDTRAPEGLTRVYGAALKDNLTIRQTTPTAESSREYPRATGIVILDDSLFALYQAVAERATAAGARLPVLFARSGRRGQLTATLSTPTSIELTGVVTGTLTVDSAGRLQRVVLADGVSAIRQSR